MYLLQLGSPGNLKSSKTNIYFKFVHINTWCRNISTDLVDFALNVAINKFVDECCTQWNLKKVDWIKYSFILLLIKWLSLITPVDLRNGLLLLFSLVQSGVYLEARWRNIQHFRTLI